MMRLMDWITDFSTTHAKTIIVVSTLLLLISAIGIAKLRFSHDALSWLPKDMPVRTATKTIDTELKGSVTLEIILDTGRENGLYDPIILNKIDQFTTELETDPALNVGKAMAVTDILKEINRALHENRPEFYTIPQDAKLIPQEFLLFENSGSDDLEDVIDSRFQLARITLKVPWQDAMLYVPFIADIEQRASRIFGPEMDITTTGIIALFGGIIYASIYSAVTSYLIAFGVITLLMILLIGSIRLGLVAMIPNLTPIIITIGGMGWLGIPLNMFTMLIGSIAIGLAVDDTIHFIYNFRRYFSKYGEPVQAVRSTLQSTGRAMLTTTIVLSLGFFIFMCASMQNLFHFGLLTGTAIILALAADFLLAPALLTLTARNATGKTAL
jgi:predicted RND superfamily exporter protein